MKRFTSALVGLQLAVGSSLMAQSDLLPPEPRDQGLWQTVAMFGVALVFFYLIMWRPEQKRRKALETQRNSLKKGDRVTAMGIIGTVSSMQEHTIILSMIDGNKIEFLKAAISDVLPGKEADAKADILLKEKD